MNSFNDFVKFISEDPVMLGLCGAIILLVLIFIIVLIFGGRKRGVASNNEETLENTSSLIVNSTNDEPLRSTQEFTLNGLDKTTEISNIEEIENKEFEKNVPISIDEAINLKTERAEAEIKDTIEIPTIIEKNPSKVAIPVMKEDLTLPIMEPIVESNTFAQPFSSVVVNSGDELPKKEENLSKTEIIRHIPIIEENNEEVVRKTKDEVSLEDIDLPKLNTKPETSVINSLTGESFKL